MPQTARTIVDGFLNIDKQMGRTSRDVVNAVQRHVRPRKVGHAGTLDPLATGVLVVAVGRATRLISYVQRMRKQYEATFVLGKTSDTEDITGVVTECEVLSLPTHRDITVACDVLTGEIQQVPPAYSALKVGGKRAYDLARRGHRVELKPRRVVVYGIDVLRYEYPELDLRIECGSGTYVRSLGRDLGERLGCGAVMSALRRTAVGAFRLGAAIEVEQAVAGAVDACLAPMANATVELPCVQLSVAQLDDLAFGRKLRLPCCQTEIAGLNDAGELAAVLAKTDSGKYRPVVNLAAKS